MIIISLFDYSGIWPLYYRYEGFTIAQVDIKDGIDVKTWNYKKYSPGEVFGIMASPPCTHFSVSGAQYWKAKDADGRTAEHVALVEKTLEIVNYFRPRDYFDNGFWALENPKGSRINKLVQELGEPVLSSHPCDYGDPYTKGTYHWGEFNIPEKTPIEPIRSSTQGSWLQRLGSASEKTKRLRSMTPPGFAKAFWLANRIEDEI